MAGVDPRRIGLSATIGDTKSAARFLGAGSRRKTTVPNTESGGQVWRLSMEHFYDNGPQADSNNFDPAQPVLDERKVIRHLKWLIHRWLIFSNIHVERNVWFLLIVEKNARQYVRF